MDYTPKNMYIEKKNRSEIYVYTLNQSQSITRAHPLSNSRE